MKSVSLLREVKPLNDLIGVINEGLRNKGQRQNRTTAELSELTTTATQDKSNAAQVEEDSCGRTQLR